MGRDPEIIPIIRVQNFVLRACMHTDNHNQPHLEPNTLLSHTHEDTTAADVRPRLPLRSHCWRVCHHRPAAVKAEQIWCTAATTWAGNRGAAGTDQGTGSDLWPRPSEHRRSGSMASPCPESAPPWRLGRTCENTAGKENVKMAGKSVRD